MSNNPPYNLTDGSLTLMLGSTPEVILSDAPAFTDAVALLRNESMSAEDKLDALIRLARPTMALTELDDARVEIVGRRVLFDGENLPTALSNKLLAVVRQGLDVTPWKRFTIRLFSNPSRGAQAELNEFLEAGNLPITEDGCFLAYKRVTEEYTDLHTHTFDNSVGAVCEMPREDVDADRNRTCSAGLHFCSQAYLKNFLSGGGRIVIVKVDPSDVVSIPTDYNYTKGRTWRYEVVGEVDLSAEDAREAWGVYDTTFTSGFDEADDPNDWDLPDYDEDDEDDEDEDDIGTEADFINFTENPAPARKGRFAEWFRRNF